MVFREQEEIDSSQALLNKLKRDLNSLFHEFDIKFAYLGGSWARNQQHWWSDIDIFVSFPKYEDTTSKGKLTLWTELNVKAWEMTKLETLEIIILEYLPLYIQFRVISQGLIIYEKSEVYRTQFIERLLNEYYDYIIWYKNYLNQSLSTIN